MNSGELESRSERVSRLVGAGLTCGALGYLIAVLADDAPLAVNIAKGAVCPIVALVFTLPRCATSSYLGRGLAAALAFGVGYASGADYSDPTVERIPGLIFIVTWFLATAWLLAGLLPVTLFNLLGYGKSPDAR